MPPCNAPNQTLPLTLYTLIDILSASLAPVWRISCGRQKSCVSCGPHYVLESSWLEVEICEKKLSISSTSRKHSLEAVKNGSIRCRASHRDKTLTTVEVDATPARFQECFSKWGTQVKEGEDIGIPHYGGSSNVGLSLKGSIISDQTLWATVRVP